MRYTYLQVADGNGHFPMGGVPTGHLTATVVFEGEVEVPDNRDGPGKAPPTEAIWERHNLERPLGKVIRSMSVGDVVVLHDGPSPSGLDDHSLVLVVASVGWRKVEGEAATRFRTMAKRGVPANGPIFEGTDDYYSALNADRREGVEPVGS